MMPDPIGRLARGLDPHSYEKLEILRSSQLRKLSICVHSWTGTTDVDLLAKKMCYFRGTLLPLATVQRTFSAVPSPN